MGASLNVVAVVLNWRRPHDTNTCVRSLAETSAQTPVVVVDNASGDGSADVIRAEHPHVDLIETTMNLGYAGGMNTAIRHALERGADAVLLLNNDVVVQPGCVESLAQTMAGGRGQHSVVAPISFRLDRPELVDFYRATVDIRRMALVANHRDERLPAKALEKPARSDYATGSAMLVDASFFGARGLFDERFFLVWEDVDLCLRIGSHSEGVVVDPRARILHARSASLGEGSPLYLYFYVRNSFLIVDKHERRRRRARTRDLLERRYRGWLDKPETSEEVAAAIRLGLDHASSARYGPPPAELMR